MLIPEWKESEGVWIRSQPVYRGEIVTRHGMIPGVPEFSPRRYSVIDARDSVVKISIGAVSYTTEFKSDDPLQVHKKYVADEWDILMEHIPPIPLEEILKWTGEAAKMKSFYN